MRAFQIAALVETAVRDERERGIIRSKPLTDQTLWEMWAASRSEVLHFARAIEEAHGIKENP